MTLALKQRRLSKLTCRKTQLVQDISKSSDTDTQLSRQGTKLGIMSNLFQNSGGITGAIGNFFSKSSSNQLATQQTSNTISRDAMQTELTKLESEIKNLKESIKTEAKESAPQYA